jgi:NADH-quinone oxidoreductase subunit L
MRKYGGLRKKMPWTFATYLLATLAIAGFPFTSGYYSKDALLIAVGSAPGLSSSLFVFEGLSLSALCTGVGLFTALLTALYMTRSVMLTFFGAYRGHGQVHESPNVMVLPLVVLAALSIGFSLLFESHLLEMLAAWTRSDLVANGHGHPVSHLIENLAKGAALGGILIAVILYGFLAPEWPMRISRAMGGLYQFCLNRWRLDELYDAVVVVPLHSFARAIFSGIDRTLVDGSVNALGMVASASSEAVRVMHTGRISHYALFMVLGVLCSILFWLLM